MRTVSLRGLHTAAIAAGLLCCAIAAHAQPAWKPDKNIEIVVGLTAGSSQDRSGRAIQSIAQAKALLGVTSAVVNRVGGGGNVAWNYLSQHAGDAHWVQIASPTILTNYLIGTAPFSYADYTPLALLGNQYIGFAERADSPLKTARSAGMDQKKLKLVIFQGGELMTAGLGGHVDVIATVTSNLLPLVQAGKLRMLGISSAGRLGGALAQVPTLKEQGVDAVLANWQGVFGPPKLAPTQIAYWDSVFSRLVKTEEWRRGQEQNLWESDYLGAADYARFLKTDFEQAKAIFIELGLARKDL